MEKFLNPSLKVEEISKEPFFGILKNGNKPTRQSKEQNKRKFTIKIGKHKNCISLLLQKEKKDQNEKSKTIQQIKKELLERNLIKNSTYAPYKLLKDIHNHSYKVYCKNKNKYIENNS